MKQLFVTACAVTALCGTALAQSPAPTDSTAPAAKSGAAMQPSKPADPMASPTNSTAAKPDGPAATSPGSATNQSPGDKAPASSGITAAKPSGAMHVTFYTVKPADVRASTLIGSTVYNANNENIGEIEDVVLEGGKDLRAVVIGVGGFLGMGEHDVAVEPSALMITRNRDNEDVRIVLNTTKEDLKNAPAVKFDNESRDKAASSGTTSAANTTGADGSTDTTYGTGSTGATNQPAANKSEAEMDKPK